jgi:hypothetical protein
VIILKRVETIAQRFEPMPPSTEQQHRADADVDLCAKKARARTVLSQRFQQSVAQTRERQRASDEANQANVALMEQYFQCFGALNALVALENYKSVARGVFRALYIQRFGMAECEEAREARRVHFNEQFATHLSQAHQAQIDELLRIARDGVYAVYAEEFPVGSAAHFEEYYQNAQRAHQMCREAIQPPKFSVAHYVRLFRSMRDDEFANLLRTGENAPSNMREGAKIVYKERKGRLDLLFRDKRSFPRARMQPHVELRL